MGSGGSFLRQHNGNLIVVGGGATGSREFDFCLYGLRDHVFGQIRVFDQMCSIYMVSSIEKSRSYRIDLELTLTLLNHTQFCTQHFFSA